MSPGERTVGYFPLSIATSLAVEGGIGKHPDHPAGPKLLKDFNHHLINAKTLFRNYYEAIGKDNIPSVDTKSLIDDFRLEIDQYLTITKEQSNNSFTPQLYSSDYLGLDTRFRHAMLRVDSTPNQVLYSKTLNLVLGEIIKNEKELIELFPLKITTTQRDKTLVLTHIPYDLTSDLGRSTALLESHTGVIKDRSRWYTKYYNGKELATIPFNEAMLAIFGDSQTFRPIGGAYRRTLIELSQKYNWSFATTRERVLFSIDSLKDRFMADNLKMFMKHY